MPTDGDGAEGLGCDGDLFSRAGGDETRLRLIRRWSSVLVAKTRTLGLGKGPKKAVRAGSHRDVGGVIWSGITLKISFALADSRDY